MSEVDPYSQPPYTIPGGEICNGCGLRYYNRSAGGPNVCPACDCGFTGAEMVKAQRAEIERLLAKDADDTKRAIERNSAYEKDAADCEQEIKRLHSLLKAAVDANKLTELIQDRDAMKAEIERLQAEVERLRAELREWESGQKFPRPKGFGFICE